MKILDITKIYSWPTADFVAAVLSSLLIFLTFSLIDRFITQIAILPQFLGFIVLTFIPGFILFRLLKISEINYPIDILLVIGLSLTFDTLAGFVLNGIGLILNYKIIQYNNIIVYYIFLLTVLCLLCIFLKQHHHSPEYIDLNIFQLSLLILIPALTVMGNFLLNNFHINFINVFIILFLSIVPMLYKFERYHVLLIWSASISLLLMFHLVSNYIWSWDIHYQFYYANLVIKNEFWDFTLSSSQNSLISIILLSPIYSTLLHLDLVWVYKIIYPFFFSLAPVGIYYIVRDQLGDDTISFFSSFIFMFYYGFFKDMVDKQFIAELFFILALSTIAIQSFKAKFLTIIFIFMMILSHYGVSYLVFISLLFILLFTSIFRLNKVVSASLLMLFFTALFSWSLFVSHGRVFESIIDIFKEVKTELFLSGERSGMQYLYTDSPSIIWLSYKGINALILIFIFVGVFVLMVSLLKKENKFKNQIYGFIAIPFSIFLIIQIVSTLQMGLDRALQIGLITLSPFFILGFIKTIELMNKLIRRYLIINKYFILSIFLSILILFNSGLIHEITGDPLPYAIALAEEHKYPDWNVYNLDEVNAVEWLKNHGEMYKIGVINSWRVLKSRDALILQDFFSEESLIIIASDQKRFDNSYLYLGGSNINMSSSYNPDLPEVIDQSDKLYSSDNSEIYLIRA